MMPPHIAAGENLSFWPLGPIFRRGGAFFIRRTFGGDKLYSAICAAYVKRLLKDGNAVEFFIEGGRSRSGKLLQPKMGLLSMCVDPVMDGAISDACFIPVSISYERIIEAKSYSRELEGGQKAKEDVGALIKSRKVLRSRYGRVYVDFDDPISLRAFAAARGFEIKERSELDQANAEPGSERRSLVSQLGHRIVYGINRVTRVTPTGVAALVLLARTLRGMGEDELHRRAERMIGALEGFGARLSNILAPATRREALRQALGRLAQDGSVLILPAPDGENIYRIEDTGRRALDFYKNNVVHFLIPASIFALGLLACETPGGVSDAVLRETSRRLSRLLKHEFSFPDAAFDQNFDATAAALERQRVIDRTGDPGKTGWSITLNGRDLAQELAGQCAPFIEGYRASAECIVRLEPGDHTEKELIQLALGLARRQAMEGRIRRAEAASQLTAQNALRILLELGVLTRAEGGKLSHSAEGIEKARALVAELDRYLARCE
jgi:glycerol-3-phosphate O-acyltransferase